MRAGGGGLGASWRQEVQARRYGALLMRPACSPWVFLRLVLVCFCFGRVCFSLPRLIRDWLAWMRMLLLSPLSSPLIQPRRICESLSFCLAKRESNVLLCERRCVCDAYASWQLRSVCTVSIRRLGFPVTFFTHIFTHFSVMITQPNSSCLCVPLAHSL